VLQEILTELAISTRRSFAPGETVGDLVLGSKKR
jgi:hypothetical protein